MNIPKFRYILIFNWVFYATKSHKMIRIDYTKLRSVKEHITKALIEDKNLYITDPTLYSYITDSL